MIYLFFLCVFFLRWGNWYSESLSILPKGTQMGDLNPGHWNTKAWVIKNLTTRYEPFCALPAVNSLHNRTCHCSWPGFLLGTTVSPPYLQVSHLWIQPTTDQKYLGGKKKFFQSSKKQKLNLLHTEHYAESKRMKWCVGTPCCSLYANIGYMQIPWHFT